jgi:hypothetical protein
MEDTQGPSGRPGSHPTRVNGGWCSDAVAGGPIDHASGSLPVVAAARLAGGVSGHSEALSHDMPGSVECIHTEQRAVVPLMIQ